MRWFEIDPCYVFHPLNGYSEMRNGAEVIVIDLVRYDSMFSQDVLGPSDAKGQLDRWTIDLAKGTVHMERKDDRHLEFPRINETFTGKKHRYGYLPDVENFFGSGEAAGASIVKYDYETGSTLSSRLDPAIVLGRCHSCRIRRVPPRTTVCSSGSPSTAGPMRAVAAARCDQPGSHGHRPSAAASSGRLPRQLGSALRS